MCRSRTWPNSWCRFCNSGAVLVLHWRTWKSVINNVILFESSSVKCFLWLFCCRLYLWALEESCCWSASCSCDWFHQSRSLQKTTQWDKTVMSTKSLWSRQWQGSAIIGRKSTETNAGLAGLGVTHWVSWVIIVWFRQQNCKLCPGRKTRAPSFLCRCSCFLSETGCWLLDSSQFCQQRFVLG